MNKVSYYFAALILGFTMSAQAQSGARTKFTPSYAQDEVQAANEMSSETTMSQRMEVLAPRTIPNPWVTLEPTVGYISSTFNGIEGIGGASVDFAERMQTGVGVLIGRGMWQFETGLLYSTRGGKLTNLTETTSYGTRTANWDVKVNYFDIPLVARLSLMHSSRSHFFFRGGLVVGILDKAWASGEQTSVSAYGVSSQSLYQDGDDFFNSTDIRGVLGAGYDWKFSRRVGLVAQAEVQQSVSKVNTDNFLSGKDVYNMGAGVSLGLTFKL
ncbi:outer membrane beta-barrel protein [Bdellovibrio sp. KM01]|uniref:outer membrane beta-barrel protein n=1 Tax=Bdellovibrio sp. KM01 TaxID=2748865 RepID=UPI0015E97CD6|nr:outer membrane beta-barrel protein [Bdellovibrio sp. KM01]QLY26044.1 outer membrane beta-barrel protein [Bdellovibrio sp. KM01]